jgi:hypothetical protein
MNSVKGTIWGLFGGMMAAGLLAGNMVTAVESGEKPVTGTDETISPFYIPVDDAGHTWTYVKTTHNTTGYSKLYSDSDAYWYYTKEAFYDKSGRYIKTVFQKLAV